MGLARLGPGKGIILGWSPFLLCEPGKVAARAVCLPFFFPEANVKRGILGKAAVGAAWLVACLASAPGARATIFDEIAVADAYIEGGAVLSSFVMVLQESPLRVPIIEFSLAAISTPVTVNSATLHINVSMFTTDTVTVHGYSGNGVVEVADAGAGTDNPVGSFSGLGLFNRDVVLDTDFIQSLLDGSATHAGFKIRGGSGQVADTSINPPQDVIPRLIIDYTVVPEPGTAALAGFGLAGMGMLARRRLRRPRSVEANAS